MNVKVYPTDRIRNVALIGHGGSGKTTLVEALLTRSKTIARAGRVEDRSTVCDTEAEEHKRGISLSLALAPFDWNGYKINLIDTPGYADFFGEVEAALRVADLAILVVSAVDGVEVQTEAVWRRCQQLGVPRLIFVNKEDKDRADFHRVLGQLRTAFGAGISPVELPLGEQAAFHGVADVLSDQAYGYETDGSQHTESMPPDVIDEEHQLHLALVEEIVARDDDQLERYLSGEEPSVEELERTLAGAVCACAEFPVLVGSALTGVGIDRLAEFVCRIGPSPSDREGVLVSAGDTETRVVADASAKSLAFVFKTIADPYVGQLSLFKVLSGTISVDDHLINTSSGADERLHGLLQLRGQEQTPISSIPAGDIGAVAKLTSTRTGDTLAVRGLPVRVATITMPPAVLAIAIQPRTQVDDDKLGSALQRLQGEDGALVTFRNEETHQTILAGTGETHLQVSLERLNRKFGVNIDIAEVKVAYRETISASAEAEGRLKKQSGGHGQYAVANLRVSPLGRGDGFSFVDSIVGGAIPRQFIPAVQKGVEEAMVSGGVHGFPVVDVKVECYDGKFHSVDSSEMAFKTAASMGFKDAIARAGAVVLEPVSVLRVRVPLTLQGEVMGDINSRRGRVHGTNTTDDGEQEIVAHVPTAEITRYAVDLRSMTGGRGRFTAEHDHYDILPAHLIDKAKTTRPSRP